MVKRKGLIILIVISALIILIASVVLYFCVFNNNYQSINIDLKEKPIDNVYNNLSNTGDSLTKINDRLYFNYYGDPLTYGTYEISDSYAKRVYWEGPSIESRYYLNLDNVYDNKLLSYGYQKNYIEYYNFEHGKNERFIKIDIPTSNNLTDFNPFVVNGNLLASIGSKIYKYSNGMFDLVASKKLCSKEYSSIAFDNDYMYFTSYKDNGESYDELCKYNLKTRKNISTIDISELGDVYSYVFADSIAFDDEMFSLIPDEKGDYYLYKFDFEKGSYEKLQEMNEECVLNGYDHKLFLSVSSGKHKGIYKFNNNKKSFELLKDGICPVELYIFGEKWLYYIDDNHVLYRVTQDGKTAEKVFG
ncbi:MAG: hypothetical protein IJ932_04510 [Ruminococcus sp.]|nr:hypothetical protein [Ruminococcus sp.]